MMTIKTKKTEDNNNDAGGAKEEEEKQCSNREITPFSVLVPFETRTWCQNCPGW